MCEEWLQEEIANASIEWSTKNHHKQVFSCQTEVDYDAQGSTWRFAIN